MDSKAMPPPPLPTLAPPLLDSEITCLTSCLKNLAVQVGQVYSFYADTRRLGIQNQAFKPPQSVTAALGREIEKYDQLCDSVESQLLRAISVLRRDLLRKERAIAAEANRLRDAVASPSIATDSAVVSLESHPEVAQQPTVLQKSSSPSIPLGRRPSAISISSLNRPAPPLKLDLSETSLRLNADDPSIFSSGLASPVTLAPKSARAMGPDEFPPELMAAFTTPSSQGPDRAVDIDLTGIPDVNEVKSSNIVSLSSQPAAGDSSDKPIVLDLDIDHMTDLFGDAPDSDVVPTLPTNVDDLFSSGVTGDKSIKLNSVDDKSVSKVDEDNYVDLSISPGNTSPDLFSSLPSNPGPIRKVDEMVTVDQSHLAQGPILFSASSHAPEASARPDTDPSFDIYMNSFNDKFMADFIEFGGLAEKSGGESKPNA